MEQRESQLKRFLARPSSAPSWWPRSAPRGGFCASSRLSMFTFTQKIKRLITSSKAQQKNYTKT